jgi:hypothetical protein
MKPQPVPKRRQMFLVLTAAVLVIVLFASLSRSRGRSYGGRTLSQWVERIDGLNASLAAQAEAEDAIRHIGTNAVPYLLKWMSPARPRSGPAVPV